MRIQQRLLLNKDHWLPENVLRSPGKNAVRILDNYSSKSYMDGWYTQIL